MLFEALLLLCFLFSFIFIFCFKQKFDAKSSPKSYPFIGNYLSYYTNRHRLTQWSSECVHNSPSLTFLLQRPFRQSRVITGNPDVVQHILQTKFASYEKGHNLRYDLLGDGIFNVDGEKWKIQKQLCKHEFNTKSLRYFVEHVVDNELNERLIPILSMAAANNTILDFQDILQRFAFDNICRIAFGYDPKCLTPSCLPEDKFVVAFEDAIRISSERFRLITPLLWKIKRFFNMGSEKRLKEAVLEIREFAMKMVNEKKQELAHNSPVDLLSRIIRSGHVDEKTTTDIVINFILAGRDSSSSALTWFFWLLDKNPNVENEIVNEIKRKSNSLVYDEVKDMVYTHASLCESMRLYPPLPVDSKMAIEDDLLPNGSSVKKGMIVKYHPYAMGRAAKVWGRNFKEFRPERWLEKDETTNKVMFVAKDSFMYPVFQAGPRICLGKDMAFLQMKKVVAGVLGHFKVVPVLDDNIEPVLVTSITIKMKDVLGIEHTRTHNHTEI